MNNSNSNFCILQPNQVKISSGNKNSNCKIDNKVEIVQNMWNYNNVTSNNILNRYPYRGVIPGGPNTGSWPCRNNDCNYFDQNNPIIPESFRNIDLLSLPPN